VATPYSAEFFGAPSEPQRWRFEKVFTKNLFGVLQNLARETEVVSTKWKEQRMFWSMTRLLMPSKADEGRVW
jgi:hypothetical protein